MVDEVGGAKDAEVAVSDIHCRDSACRRFVAC